MDLRLKTVERKSEDKTKIVLSNYLLKKDKDRIDNFLVFLFILSKSFITIKYKYFFFAIDNNYCFQNHLN